MAERAGAGDGGARAGLVVGLDRRLSLLKQVCRLARPNTLHVFVPRTWLPRQEVATRLDPVAGDLMRRQNQARDGVTWASHLGHVPPGIRRITAVDADRGAVDAASRLVGLSGVRGPAGVA